MLGRRRNKRFKVTEPSEGTLRLFRDVTVQRIGDDEWIAISCEPAIVGETLVLDVFDVDESERQRRFRVHVIESRPVIITGDVQYRIRLHAGEFMPVPVGQPIRPS
jgi:hypothetical protein